MGARVTGSGKARGPLGSLKDLMGAKGDGCSLMRSLRGPSRILRGGGVGGGGSMWRLAACVGLSAFGLWAGRGRRVEESGEVGGKAMEEAGKDSNKGNQTNQKKKGPYIHNKRQSPDQDQNLHNKCQNRDQGQNTDPRSKCQRTNLSGLGPYAQNKYQKLDLDRNHDTQSNCQRPKGPYGRKNENAEQTTGKDTEQRRSQGQSQFLKQGPYDRATKKSKKQQTTTTQDRKWKNQSSR